MKKYKSIISSFFALFALFMIGCTEDFPTKLNMEYAESDEPTPGEQPEVDNTTITLGSYNLWISNKGTGDYIWSKRRYVLAQSIVDNKFDIFGFQEANGVIQSELPKLVEQAGGKYEWWFVGRDSQDGTSGETLGIAYNPDRFQLVDKHFFWLSDTPDVMSYGWGETGYHRIAACAMVYDIVNKKKFFMMVTHAPLNNEACANAASLIIEREKMYNAEEAPSVFVGDLNSAPSDQSSVIFRSYWKDAMQTVDPKYVYGSVATFQSHNVNADMSKESNRIDYIYVRSTTGDLDLKSYTVDNKVYDGIYPSDHCPIKIQMNINYVLDLVEGSGTKEDPWQINSVSDWNTIAGSISGSGSYKPEDSYKLMNDVDFTGCTFVPLSKLDGTLDGNNFTLKGVKFTTANAVSGPICVNGGVVKNLNVEADITSSYRTVGGVVGQNEGLIDGVTFKGNITGDAEAAVIGGIAGQNKGVVVNCANIGGNISAKSATKSENIGGIVGQVSSGNYIINCYSLLEGIESSNNNLGGVVGIVSDDSYIINCYSTIAAAQIVGNGSMGVVAGYSKKGNILNVFGNVDGDAVKAIGNDKKAGTIWKDTKSLLLTIDQMKSDAVTLPSNSTEYSSLGEALNQGVKEFNDLTTTSLPTKPDVTLRTWTTKTGNLPTLK